MFPQLVSIMLTEETEQYGWGPEKHQRMWETRFHMHLYGTITPIELVRAAVSRPPPEDKDDEHFQDFLSKWDAANDADNDNTTSSESSAESENTYDNEFTGLTLHKYARLITNERFPSASLSTPMEGGWKILPNRDEDYIFVPRLDIRHLTAKDAQLNQTLRGCTWLVQGPLYTRFRTDSIAEVDCRLEVILPLLETVSFPSAYTSLSYIIRRLTVYRSEAFRILYHTMPRSRHRILRYCHRENRRLSDQHSRTNETSEWRSGRVAIPEDRVRTTGRPRGVFRLQVAGLVHAAHRAGDPPSTLLFPSVGECANQPSI
jgi:hypothetical protein